MKRTIVRLLADHREPARDVLSRSLRITRCFAGGPSELPSQTEPVVEGELNRVKADRLRCSRYDCL
jgi:hypothetical protein